MNAATSTRRIFLIHGALAISGAVLLDMVPEALHAARQDAKTAAAAGDKFLFFTPEEGGDVKAFAAHIFPSDDTPGANEANVVYFIDRVLQGSKVERQQGFRTCIAALNEDSAQLFPGTTRFSTLSVERQAEVITKFQSFVRKRRSDLFRGVFEPGDNPFETMRTYVIAGFLSDPMDGGNKDSVGWDLIGFDGMGAHESPFGFYDAELLKGKKQ